MQPMTFEVDYVVTHGKVVKFFCCNPISGECSAVHVDHRRWSEIWKDVGSQRPGRRSFVAAGVWLALDFKAVGGPLEGGLQ